MLELAVKLFAVPGVELTKVTGAGALQVVLVAATEAICAGSVNGVANEFSEASAAFTSVVKSPPRSAAAG